MRKARVERQRARMGARQQVEDQAGEDDADPAGRDQPQLGPHQAKQQRHRGARKQQQDRAAGRIGRVSVQRGTSSRSSSAATTSSTLRPSISAAADRMTRWRSTPAARRWTRSEEHTSELESLMRISYAVFCLKKQKKQKTM